jgi:peptide/nickel transport system permease protein
MTVTSIARNVSVHTRFRRRNWLRIVALIAAGVIAGIVVAALLAPWIAPANPNAVNLGDAFAPPSASHLLGTDASGRDLLSRLLWGARPALLGPTLAVLIATTAGSGIAVFSAWLGGLTDRVISRVVDVLFAFPGILLALLAAAVFGAGFGASIIAVGVAEIPYIARVVRTEALRQRSRPYVEAMVVQGFSSPAVVFRHLVPNVLPIIYTQMTLSFGYVMINLASVSYLGLGIQPPSADWGSMVSEGQSSLIQGYPQESLYAGFAIVLVVVAFTIFGDYVAIRAESKR